MIGRMDSSLRRSRLAERLPVLDVDAFLVTRLPNVRYLTGFTGSNGQLVLGRADSMFLTDGRYTEQAGHEVPDMPRIVYSGDLANAFGKACAELGVKRVAFEAAGVTYRAYQTLAATGVDLAPAMDEVEALRWVKDPEELRNLEAAQAVADDAFDVVIGKLSEGMTEREVAFDLDMTMRRLGAEAVSFETIVAFGENAAEPHHSPTSRPVGRGDVVKIDYGSVVDGFHSDTTRTVAFGEPDARLREIHEIVLRAQQAGIDAVRPGVSGGEADEAARAVIRDAGYADNYTHSLGHGVGLEVHEGPYLRAAGTDILPEGTVVTVEPGIYVGGLGGVRIEDMVVVTSDGCRTMPRTARGLTVL
jgi:Xaa-Pro aminopeptidase